MKRNLELFFRWSARLLSVVSIVLIALMALDTPTWPNSPEAVALLFFPVMVVAGFILSWWKELAGSLLSIGGLGVFYFWMAIAYSQLPRGPYFFIFTLPALLYLCAWFAAEEKPREVRR